MLGCCFGCKYYINVDPADIWYCSETQNNVERFSCGVRGNNMDVVILVARLAIIEVRIYLKERKVITCFLKIFYILHKKTFLFTSLFVSFFDYT